MSYPNLIEVLREARRLLALPGNDFDWSSWRDGEHALAEIDGMLALLEARESLDLSAMEVLFAPTGPMQEVSLSSGWGDAFVQLADSFDAAIAGL